VTAATFPDELHDRARPRVYRNEFRTWTWVLPGVASGAAATQPRALEVLCEELRRRQSRRRWRWLR
jgi:hypothetical protein